ncbi:MAG: hypothetical protein JOY79_00040 [Acidobacteriaceae bacterium]|nr:hypothetical protein [Acidobacteriaceae bacterium]
MADVSRNGRDPKCPLCEGHGHLQHDDLISRLSDPHFMESLAAWRRAMLEELEKQQEPVCATTSFDREVHSWPNTHFLWRRSPKE